MAPRTRLVFIVAAIGATLAVVGGWYFFIRDDAPPPLTLEDAVTATTAPPVEPPGTTIGPASSEPPAPTNAAVSTDAPVPTNVPTTEAPAFAESWSIDPGGTIVGYRIEEELAGIGGATAVGRTSQVAGTLVLDGAAITEVAVTVDMSTLESDDDRRDRQLRTRGLQTSEFPEATFVLDETITLDDVPVVGVAIQAMANGTLTLHGVSRSVAISLEAQLLDESTIVVVGATEVVLTDYDINAPVGFSVLSVAETGLFEFQLTFKA